MLNQVVLVGRLTSDPVIKEVQNNKVSNITLAVPRSYKNVSGEYETDFINCTLWQGIASNAKEYCKKGDIVGIRGRLEVNIYEKDEDKKYITNVIVEKLSFLSSNKPKEAE